MKKTIAFDIETIPSREAVALMPEPEPAIGNLKDPVKIQAKIDAAKEAQLKEASLSPALSSICCFGWATSPEESGCFLLNNYPSEKELLQDMWELLNKYNYFVSFNGMDFDVPHMQMHSLIHRVRPSVKLSTRKYYMDNHYDIRQILNNWDSRAKGKMDFYAQLLLGISKTEGIDGGLVSDMWDMEMYEQIGNYCEDDCKITFALYEVIQEYWQ